MTGLLLALALYLVVAVFAAWLHIYKEVETPQIYFGLGALSVFPTVIAVMFFVAGFK